MCRRSAGGYIPEPIDLNQLTLTPVGTFLDYGTHFLLHHSKPGHPFSNYMELLSRCFFLDKTLMHLSFSFSTRSWGWVGFLDNDELFWFTGLTTQIARYFHKTFIGLNQLNSNFWQSLFPINFWKINKRT